MFEAHCLSQSHLVETITGVQTVKAVCAEQPIRWRWEELLLKYIRLQFRSMNYHLLLDSAGGGAGGFGGIGVCGRCGGCRGEAVGSARGDGAV